LAAKELHLLDRWGFVWAHPKVELYRWLGEPHWERAAKRLEALRREAGMLLGRAFAMPAVTTKHLPCTIGCWATIRLIGGRARVF
jgi:hypothetical protein